MQIDLERCQASERWQPQSNNGEFFSGGNVTKLQQWLIDSGSLTQRLNAQFDGLEYRLLSADEQTPWDLEQEYLLINDAPCWTRQVWFGEKKRDFVFSKVVVPPLTLAAVGDNVIDWGDKPLGRLLFREGLPVRHQLQLKYLGPSSPYLGLAQSALGCSYEFAWARRSLCFLKGYPMLIIDLFLPDLIRELNEC